MPKQKIKFDTHQSDNVTYTTFIFPNGSKRVSTSIRNPELICDILNKAYRLSVYELTYLSELIEQLR